MLIFLDESFRQHKQTGRRFGVLSGVAIPEDTFHAFQRDLFGVRRPYHGRVLGEDAEIHGNRLLNSTTLKVLERNGWSLQWNLAEEILQFSAHRHLKVFGVVCFRNDLHSFVCDDEVNLDVTYRYLFERIDAYMKREFPGRTAKLIFDNRDHRTHEKNAKAITNFFVRSRLGLGYDSILRIPFFAVSQGHNYGLQLADLITTVIALYFQGRREFRPLWKVVKSMLYMTRVGGAEQSSLKVMRDQKGKPWE
jgi:hypothetical protein